MVKYLDNDNQSGFQKFAASGSKKQSNFIWWLVLILMGMWAFSIWSKPAPTVVIDKTPVISEDVSKVPVTKLDSDKVIAYVQGLRINKFVLKDFKAEIKPDSLNIKLLEKPSDFVEVGFVANGTSAPTAGTVWKKIGDKMVWRNADGVEFTRNISTDGYVISVNDTVKNTGNHDIGIAPYARIKQEAVKNKTVAVATGGIAMVDDGIERKSWKKIEKKSYVWQASSGFVGFEEQYWQTVLKMSAPDQTIRMKHSQDSSSFQADAAAATVQVAAGKTSEFSTKIYAGPKNQSDLQAALTHISGIDQTIDYGWFWFLARPFLAALNALFALVGNYGVAIILLTIGLRFLMWPLTRKSYTSMAAMQKMQPEMQRIQKLYANDKVRMQQEMLRLYQTSKTSPMSGCLPMLLQIPIFFALYKALLISVPMRMAGFLWISDLSVMDPYFILPVLMGITMWWQQKLQSASTNASGEGSAAQMQRAMKWMPIIFTIMFAWMPAGLVLYWAVSNMFGILQMYIIKKVK